MEGGGGLTPPPETAAVLSEISELLMSRCPELATKTCRNGRVGQGGEGHRHDCFDQCIYPTHPQCRFPSPRPLNRSLHCLRCRRL